MHMLASLLPLAVAAPLAAIPAEGSADQQYHHKPAPLAVGASIEWRRINLLHLTDVHSFIAGNRHEGVDADYGDLVSFVQHLHALADARGVDLFVLNTGDLVDGTGMSDATPVAGEFLAPILKRIPYDALTIGNHELYEDSTVENLETSGFLQHFGERIVTSNQRLEQGGHPPIGGSQHTVLEGRNGARLLAFGFLFNFQSTGPATLVERVEEVVQERWFAAAVAEHAGSVDAVVVLAHMGWDDSAVEIIRTAIRQAADAPLLPIVVLAGHTHIRRFQRLDDHAAVLESGRYFDCIGAISFTPDADRTWFEYAYEQTSLENLRKLSGTDEQSFPTREGALVKAEIAAVRERFGLDEVLGCTPDGVTRLRRSLDLADPDSLWRLALTEVIPSTVFHPPLNSSQILIAGSGGIRYDIFSGFVTRDDTMIVSPFRDEIYRFAALTAEEASTVLASLGVAVPGEASLPGLVATARPEAGSSYEYDLLALDFDLTRVRDAVREATGDGRTEVPYRHGELDTTTMWEAWVSANWAQHCEGLLPGRAKQAN